MKNIKGFIQIPLLIAIIAGVLVVGGGGYLGVKQYKNLQSDKQELTRGGEKAKEGNENIKSAELETLRKEIDELKSQPPQFIVKERISVQERIIEKPSGTITVDYNSISAQEIDHYLTGIVSVNTKAKKYLAFSQNRAGLARCGIYQALKDIWF